MNPSLSTLTQSRYYSPAFNSAIFDGPIRIYFAQYQEPAALKIYFRAKEILEGLEPEVRLGRKHIFVLVYPTEDTFEMSFSGEASGSIKMDRLGEDHLIGLKGPPSDADVEHTLELVEGLLHAWRPQLAISAL